MGDASIRTEVLLLSFHFTAELGVSSFLPGDF